MNPWQSALQLASQTHTWAVGMCDNFVANMYGYSSSGYNTALDHWNAIPGASQHPGDMNAPAGALMFWGGNADGHVAISDGNGGIYSTDISGQGTVSHVPSSEISSKWGLQYLGWSPPIFQSGPAGSVGNYSGVEQAFSLNPGDIVGGIVGGAATAASGGLLGFLTGGSGFGIDIKDLAERAGLILLGGILVLIALYRISGVSGSAVKNAIPNSGESGSLVPSGEHGNG